jgi:thiamine biosynthesis lipoprotein
MSFRLVCLSLLFLIITACQKPVEGTYKRQLLSFGTQIEITLYDVERDKADQAIKQIEQQLDVMHNQWHAWRRSSVTKLNEQLQAGKSFEAEPGVLPLLIESKDLFIKTKGLFNPAVGKLIELWGFYSDNPGKSASIPPLESIQKLVTSNPTMLDIIIEGNILKGTNADLQIDFGGYAKGYGVDRLVEQLKKNNIHNALINAGGDIRAIGHPGNRAWKIAIQHPTKQQALGWIELEDDESVFSSGDYRRNFTQAGKIYHHIIDPRTGFPSQHAKAVTVIHNNGAVADASATALMVAEKSEWLEIAKNIGLKHLLVVDRDGQLYSDVLFAKRLHLTDENMSINTLGIL